MVILNVIRPLVYLLSSDRIRPCKHCLDCSHRCIDGSVVARRHCRVVFHGSFGCRFIGLLIALELCLDAILPRILTMFLKDRVSQATLGIFIGTFAYCLILLPNVHAGNHPDVPALSMSLALFLATGCIFYLIFFIHHIALAIQANHIVARIAAETEKGLRRSLAGC